MATVQIEPKKSKKQGELEELDSQTLAAIDKVARWNPGTEGIEFDKALKNARVRHHAWQNANLDQSA